MQMEIPANIPDDESVIGRILKSTSFNIFVGLIILLNMVTIGVESDFYAESEAIDRGCPSAVERIQVCPKYLSIWFIVGSTCILCSRQHIRIDLWD